jgi:hypothetical protein
VIPGFALGGHNQRFSGTFGNGVISNDTITVPLYHLRGQPTGCMVQTGGEIALKFSAQKGAKKP